MNEFKLPEITGELHNWRRDKTYFSNEVILGNIYNDFKRRFTDGEYIHTSKLVKIEGDLAYTTYSVYRLIGEEVASNNG